MTGDQHEESLTTLLLDADPADVVALRDISGGGAAHLLRDAITSRPDRASSRRRRRLSVLAVAAVVAVATPLALTLVGPSSSHDSAYAAQAVEFARNAPRLLARADGWRVTDLNDYQSDEGELTFRSDSLSLDVEWVTPANSLDDRRSDPEIAPAGHAVVDGHRVWIGRYRSGPGNYFDAVWSVGDQALEARGRFPGLNSFRHVLQSLRSVGVRTFLRALPASEVTPAGRRATVEAMLRDIPQPPGFDSSQLTDSPLLLDRYQLGAQVATAVGCAWYHVWRNGDGVQQIEAGAAMATSHHWAILRRMKSEGGFSQEFWEGADGMNGKPIGGPAYPGEPAQADLVENRLC